MEASTKKGLKVALIVLLAGGLIYGGYKLYKHITTKSADERKNTRRITFKKAK